MRDNLASNALTDAIKPRVDLVKLVLADCPWLRRVASTSGGTWAGHCPKCGGTDRLRVKANGLWHCNQCHSDWGDCYDYVEWRDGVGFVTARAWLADWAGVPLTEGGPVRRPRGRTKAVRALHPSLRPEPCQAPPTLWQERGRSFVAWTQAKLWSDEGTETLAYLREKRGLTDETIRSARLGYNLRPDGTWPHRTHGPVYWGLPEAYKYVRLPRGIVVPCEMAGTLYYVKARQPDGDLSPAKGGSDRYRFVTGSKPGGAIYGLEALAGHDDLILTEGEFDCLLLRQLVGAVADVATLGAAGSRMGPEAQVAVGTHQRVWVALDVDTTGEERAAELLRLSPRMHRLRPPVPQGEGKDITDAWRAKIDLRAWVVRGIGPQDPVDRLRWCERYLNRVDGDGLQYDLWMAILAEYERLYAQTARALEGCGG